MKQPLFWVIAGFSTLFLACHSPAAFPVAPAFYCWQTGFSLTPSQQEYLRQTGCRKLYVKVADVGLEPGTREIIPYAQVQITDTTGLAAFDLVRVVFITNEVFREITGEKIEWLAEKIVIAHSRVPFPACSLAGYEFQVDCDWTNSTREAYFRFLKILRNKLPPETRLSATIRLHQYKFPDRTGVPPVDRGMLMCYNTGDINDAGAANSIFDPADAQKYILGAPEKYPLPLDLALPAFSWTLVYREDELWKIIPGDHATLPAGLVDKGTFVAGHYLRPGDLIRRETISAGLLKTAAQLGASTDLADNATLAFFHLDTSTPRDYPVQLIDAVCHIADSIRAEK